MSIIRFHTRATVKIAHPMIIKFAAMYLLYPALYSSQLLFHISRNVNRFLICMIHTYKNVRFVH